MRLLTKKAFKEWLHQHDPDHVVGYRSYPESCPIAFFLRGLPDVFSADVSRKDYYITTLDDDEDEIGYETPKWAEKFILAIDRGPNRKIRDEVTAEEALKALK